MLSPQTKYAIQALRWLEQNQDALSFTQVVAIAESTNIPAPYLSKIMKRLSELGIVDSKKGLGGGVRLNAKNRNTLTFATICEALDDPLIRDECILLRKMCDSKSPCPFHGEWSGTKKKFLDFLKNSKLVN
jgi:Rrf2 family protein